MDVDSAVEPAVAVTEPEAFAAVVDSVGHVEIVETVDHY